MKKISQLWADKIIAGDKTYAEVPAQLKDEVKQALKEKGYPKLAKQSLTQRPLNFNGSEVFLVQT